MNNKLKRISANEMMNIDFSHIEDNNHDAGDINGISEAYLDAIYHIASLFTNNILEPNGIDMEFSDVADLLLDGKSLQQILNEQIK